ncbi:MAG: hypothetical protein ABI947_14945 [Chloroflexota bacterium]
MSEWKSLQANPTSHLDYKNRLFRGVLDEIRTVQPAAQKAEFDLRVMKDHDYCKWLFVREWNRHTLELGSDFDISPNPQIPAGRSVEAGHPEN